MQTRYKTLFGYTNCCSTKTYTIWNYSDILESSHHFLRNAEICKDAVENNRIA